MNKESENVEIAQDKGVNSTDLLSDPCLHEIDKKHIQKMLATTNINELLIYIRDYEYYPEYYEAPSGRREYIELIINKIDSLLSR